MRNGMYKYKHNHLNDEVYIKAYNGNITLHRLDNINKDIMCFDYVGRIDEEKVKSDYTFIEEVKQNSSWNLVYYINGTKQATIINNGAYGLCCIKKQELRRTTHKTGLLLIERM